MLDPGPSNRLHIHRHAVHAFEDFLDVLKKYDINKSDSRVSSMLHHLRHVVWRSGIEVHRNDRVYIEQGNIKLGESK